MRRATHDTNWYLGQDGELLGLTLGFDFCAEHEMGDTSLRSAFGIADRMPEGLEDRKIRKVPASLQYEEFTRKPPHDKRRKAYACAILTNDPYVLEHFHKRGGYAELGFWAEPHERWYKPEYDLTCAWSRGNFAILVRGLENIQRLKALHDAFLRLDIVFGTPTAGFVDRRGLSFMLDSKVAPEIRTKVLEDDRDHKRLLATAEATGIVERLKAAGRRWFALSPAWAGESKQSVRFWLNPMEQQRYNFGWYGVEELDAWAAGHGPIVKAAKAAG